MCKIRAEGLWTSIGIIYNNIGLRESLPTECLNEKNIRKKRNFRRYVDSIEEDMKKSLIFVHSLMMMMIQLYIVLVRLLSPFSPF
jgi:hypothetical protein